jgi:hypothetical protein
MVRDAGTFSSDYRADSKLFSDAVRIFPDHKGGCHQIPGMNVAMS